MQHSRLSRHRHTLTETRGGYPENSLPLFEHNTSHVMEDKVPTVAPKLLLLSTADA
jgi:hypothetical protein